MPRVAPQTVRVRCRQVGRKVVVAMYCAEGALFRARGVVRRCCHLPTTFANIKGGDSVLRRASVLPERDVAYGAADYVNE
jgi:hypothetical protein